MEKQQLTGPEPVTSRSIAGTLAAEPCSHPASKLHILNSVCVNGYDGRCWKVREKNHRRVLMMLRGGSVPFQIETGRWKGVPRKERVCRECEMTEEIEDCNHWLLRCPQWDSERQHLLTSVEKRLPNFALLTDDIQSSTITDL